METLRQLLGQALTSSRLFYFPTDSLIVFALILVASLSCIGVTLKVWNNTRLEIKLAEQEVLVVRARLDALANQINPHFLFNTLNSIASLIRSNPAKARATVLKLSHILRKLLQGHENFIPLREEVEFIDNYLDIEVSRFGKDKLRVEKEIDDRTLSCLIPSMILQPIIENSIRHGISPKIEGGRIRICSALQEERLCIQVADDGLGISNDKLSSIYHSGIGISNVLERLKVAYQTDFAFTVSSRPGKEHSPILKSLCSNPAISRGSAPDSSRGENILRCLFPVSWLTTRSWPWRSFTSCWIRFPASGWSARAAMEWKPFVWSRNWSRI